MKILKIMKISNRSPIFQTEFFCFFLGIYDKQLKPLVLSTWVLRVLQK